MIKLKTVSVSCYFDAQSLIFTWQSFADGLTFTIKFACHDGIEVPRPFVTRAPFRSISVVFALHRISTRIEHSLGAATILN